MAKNVLADMSKAVEMVRFSDLDWTVVRLPMLTDDPKTGKVKVAYVGKGMGVRIARADIAPFLLDQVEDENLPASVSCRSVVNTTTRKTRKDFPFLVFISPGFRNTRVWVQYPFHGSHK